MFYRRRTPTTKHTFFISHRHKHTHPHTWMKINQTKTAAIYMRFRIIYPRFTVAIVVVGNSFSPSVACVCVCDL